MATITREVLRMYRSHPFPQWTREERRHRLAAELCRYRYLGLEEAMDGARFLDVGCGTGNRSMLAAKHLNVAEFVGFDQSEASLEIAKRVATDEDFDRFTPVQGSLFELPFDDGSFDVVVSWGVLHHTPDPVAGWREMVRVCKPGGYLGIFLYNKFNHWRHNRQKDKVGRVAGDDFERRFQVAHALFGNKPIADMSSEEIVVFYDQYCHPHKSDHTLGETLTWFEQNGVSYYGSYPPLRIRDAASCVQYRAELRNQFPSRKRQWTAAFDVAQGMPGLSSSPSGPYRRPSVGHRALWQAIYAWRGRHGQYSIGAALSGRKLQAGD